MARRRRNPVFDPISREVEAAVSGSMVVVDKWFEQLEEARRDQMDAVTLGATMAEEFAESLEIPASDDVSILWKRIKKKQDQLSAADVERVRKLQDRINKNEETIRLNDRRIDKYYKSALRNISSRLATFRATPGSTLYVGEYNDAMKKLEIAKKQSQFANVDIRPKISYLRGAVAALEEALSFAKPTGIERRVAEAKERLAPPKKPVVTQEEYWVQYVAKWKMVRARAIKTLRFKEGREKVDYAESKALKVTPTPAVRFYQEVIETDLLMRIIKRKKLRGEDVSKNFPRLKRMINNLETVMRERPRDVTSAQVISGLATLRKDMLGYRTKKRRSPKELAAFQGRLTDLKGLISLKTTAEWSPQDRRTAIASVRQLESVLTTISPVEGAPVRRHRIPAKAIAKRAGNPKKKRKKKATKKRKSNPGSETLSRISDSLMRLKLDEAFKRAGFPSSGRITGVQYTESAPYGPPVRPRHIRIMVDTKVPKYEEYDIAKAAIEDCIEEVIGTRPKHVMNDGRRIHWDIPISSLAKNNPKKKAAKKKRNPETIKPRKRKGYTIQVQGFGGEYGYDAVHPEHGPLSMFGYPSPSKAFGAANAAIDKTVGLRLTRAFLDNPKKKSKKKKAAKKKTARKVTPEWQRLIRQCQKLWDHYCKRPGKARLKAVLKHLEKMEGHASQKVLDERKKCLRVAKTEAKRLKLK